MSGASLAEHACRPAAPRNRPQLRNSSRSSSSRRSSWRPPCAWPSCAPLYFAALAVFGWRDVLVDPEQVGRVVATLYSAEPVPRLSRIRRTDARLALIDEKVHVCAIVALLQRGHKAIDPRLIRRSLLSAFVH